MARKSAPQLPEIVSVATLPGGRRMVTRTPSKARYTLTPGRDCPPIDYADLRRFKAERGLGDDDPPYIPPHERKPRRNGAKRKP